MSRPAAEDMLANTEKEQPSASNSDSSQVIEHTNSLSDSSSSQHKQKEKSPKKKSRKEKKKEKADAQQALQRRLAELEKRYEGIPENEVAVLKAQTTVLPTKATFFTLYKYATPVDIVLVVLGIFFSIIHGVALPMFTLVVGAITNNFNSYLGEGTASSSDFLDKVNHNALYFVYIGIAMIGGATLESFFLVDRGEVVTSRYRKNYLRSIVRQNIAYFDMLGSGEVTTRITNDTAAIQEAISEKLGNIIQGVSTFIAALAISFATQWKLAAILLSAVAYVFGVMGLSSTFMIKYVVASEKRYSTGSSIAEEALMAIRNTVAFNSQSRVAGKYDSELIETTKLMRKSHYALATMLGLIWGGIFFIYALAYWEGSRLIASFESSIGHVVTVVISMLIGAFQLGNIAPNIQAVVKGLSAAKTINETIERKPPIDSLNNKGLRPESVEGHIVLKNVKFRYPSRPDVLVLPDYSLEILPGQTVALVGSSGSGKSTIVGILERFYQPLEGLVTLDGVDINELNVQWLRQQIGYVQQEPTLFAETIFENICHGLIGTEFEHAPEEVRREKVYEACKLANAYDFIMSMTDGFDTNVGERGFLMSGGQKQRISIARAIVGNPKILLLDEATSALDTKSEGIVQQALDRAAKKRTTITIAHRLSTIRDADKIVVMDKGHIVEQGTHNELLANQGLYSRLVNAQQVGEPEDENLNDDDELEKDDDGEFVDAPSGADEKPQALVDDGKSGAQPRLDRRSSAASKLSKSSRRHSNGLLIQEDELPLQHSLTRVPTTYTDIPGVEKAEISGWHAFREILKLTAPERKFLIVSFICAVGVGYSYIALALVTAKIIGAIIVPTSMYDEMRHNVNMYTGYFFMIGVIDIFLAFVMNLFATRVSSALVRRIRLKLFKQYMRMDVAFFDHEDNSPGTLTSVLAKDGKAIEGVGGSTLAQIMQSLVTLFGGIITGIAFQWRIGLVATACVPFLVATGFLRVWILNRMQERAKAVYGNSGGLASQYATAVRTVQSLTREDDVCDRYSNAVDSQVRQSRLAIARSAIVYGLTQGLTPWIVALVFWYGSHQMAEGKATVFQYFVVFMSIVLGAQSAGQMFSYAPDLGKGKNAAKNVIQILESSPKIDLWAQEGEIVVPQKASGDIEFRDVHFRYPTRAQVPVLRGLNLKVHKGQYIALVGPSGCGKSTTIGLIERFYDTMSGQVLFDGKNIQDLNLESYRATISMVQQEPMLYSGTIRENILMGWPGDPSEISEERLHEIARLANIHDFIMSLPEGYDTNTGSRGGLLSGGQKQRVAIARALIRDPKVLLLDEATSALDSESEKVVQAALDDAAVGRTTIAVAHRLSTIQKADIIYVFENGVICEQGNHSELMAKKSRYYELVKLQSLEERH